MAARSSHDTGSEELEILLENDENYFRALVLQQNQTAGAASESASSTNTTPGLLDTAFLNETDVDDQHGQISLSAAQSQTAQAASSAVHRMIDTIVERQREISCLDAVPATMVSTGTMPMTPAKMVSFGTMPRTPMGMASIGTTPSKPTPLAAATTTSLSLTHHEIIDLCSPTLPVIDLVSPSTPSIDLLSPNTPTNTDAP